MVLSPTRHIESRFGDVEMVLGRVMVVFCVLFNGYLVN